RRGFFDGICLPLVVMAAEGFFAVVLPWLREHGRRLLSFGYVSFASVGSIFLLLGPPLVISNPAYSVPDGDYAALQWLSPRPAGVVLTSDRLGLFVPAYTSDTTYVGQYSETYNWRAKSVEVNALLHGQGDLRGFIVQHHVRYLVWSTEDTNLAPPASLGPPAFTAKGVEVFQLY